MKKVSKVYCHTEFFHITGKWYFDKGKCYEANMEDLDYYGTIWVYQYRNENFGRGHTFYWPIPFGHSQPEDAHWNFVGSELWNRFGRSTDNFRDYFWTEKEYRREKLKSLKCISQ